jgi:DNA-directed RNA polymerase specialized sigma24 family protein
MSFPETRLTFIERLASGDNEDDWRDFLKDYWGPVCRFALRWGAGNLADAEDVAAQTFEVLWENRLLVRWVSNRSARLRSLLCGVVRKILANRGRTRENRQRLGHELAQHIEQLQAMQDDQADAFYMAWVEGLLQRAVESLAAEYCRQAKGDYVRVLYGRLCQAQSIAEVAQSLGIGAAAVDHYFRDAKARLAEKLQAEVRRQVNRYSNLDEAEEDFALEWGQLGQYLAKRGGLEDAVGRAYQLLDPVTACKRRGAAIGETLTRLTAVRPISDAVSRCGETI